MTDFVDPISIALGEVCLPDDGPAIKIRGAWNNYNARGLGSTTVRRAYDGSKWHWLSPPPSRGRYNSTDRHDVQYGDVWLGQIIAQYTLGQRHPKPDAWYIVTDGEKDPLREIISVTKRRDGRWSLTFDDGRELVVSDPAWR